MIESALGWIGRLAEFAGSLFPRLLVVQSSHRAVKYRNGWEPLLLEPGRHVYWPVMSPIETCAVVRQTLEVPARLLEAQSGEALVASAVIEYEIEDAILFLAETENGYDSIRLVAGASVREAVQDACLEELRDPEHLVVLHRLLSAELQERLEPYGVRVLTVKLADLARVRPVHLTGVGLGRPHGGDEIQ